MNEFGMYKLQLTHQEEIKRRGGNMISIFSNVIVQSFPLRFSGNTLMEKYLSIFFLVNSNKGLELEGFCWRYIYLYRIGDIFVIGMAILNTI